MAERNRQIFRSQAVAAYYRSQEDTVMPRYVRPRTVRCLWLLLVLAMALAVVIGLAKVPVYASGPAVVVARHDQPDDFMLVAFLPPEYREQLAAGQQVHLNETIDLDAANIETILPGPSSPAAVQREFNLAPTAARIIARPTAVVVVTWMPPANTHIADYAGAIYTVRVAVDSRPLYSYLLSMTNYGASE